MFKLDFGAWNCCSYSNTRHEFCKSLRKDVLDLTKLRNNQKIIKDSTLWITSDLADNNKEGKWKMRGPGRWRDNYALAENENKNTRQRLRWYENCLGEVTWPHLSNLLYRHIYRTNIEKNHRSRKQDVVAQLEELLRAVPHGDCIVLCGDFNCQLRRNVPGCTDKWVMTKHNGNEDKDHDQQILTLLRRFDLFDVVDTRFKPPLKRWAGKSRRCNETYLPKHQGRRTTKLDYFFVSVSNK